MKFEWSDMLGYIGWSLLVFLIFYVLFKILGLVQSPTLEELILGALFTQLILIGNLQAKLGNHGYRMTQVENIIQKHDKILDRIESRLGRIEEILLRKKR